MTRCSDVLESEALALAGGSLNFLAAVYDNWTKQVNRMGYDMGKGLEL